MEMSFLKGLRGRLLVLLGLPVLALMLVSGVSYYGIDTLSKSVTLFGNQRIPITSKVNEMEALSHAAPRFMWLALAHDGNMSDRKKFIGRAMTSMEDLKSRIDEYGNYQISQEARERINGLKEPATRLLELMSTVKTSLEVGTEKEDRKAKEDLVEKMPQYAVKLSEGFNQLSTIAAKRNGEIVATATSQASNLVYAVVLLAVMAIGVSIVFGLIMAMRLSSSLTRINASVGSSSEQVSAASDQISNASQQLASASQEQASALEETAASLEELSGMVENNMKSAEGSTMVAESVREAVDKSDHGHERPHQINGRNSRIQQAYREPS
jgi:methyl-accepting chemotaxis protein